MVGSWWFGFVCAFAHLLDLLWCVCACVRVCLCACFFFFLLIKSREEEGKKKGVENLDRDLFTRDFSIKCGNWIELE